TAEEVCHGPPHPQVSTWYGSCTAIERKALQRVVRAAQCITGVQLPNLLNLYTSRCLRKTRRILKDSTHPSHCLFSQLPSGRWFRSLGFEASSPLFIREYHYVNEKKTWLEAQSYCRVMYSDLATVGNIEEMRGLVSVIDSCYTGSVWIGLRRGDQSSWGWSMGDDLLSKYSNWTSGEPAQAFSCGIIPTSTQTWSAHDCSQKHFGLCYDANPTDDGRRFVGLTPTVTWKEAQTLCRKKYTDLVSIHSLEEHQTVAALKKNYSFDYMWIGLFRDSWVWSDQSNSLFRYWADSKPGQTDKCVSVAVNDFGRWYDEDCGLQHNFVCYRDLKRRKQVVRLKVSSGSQMNLNDPTVNSAILVQIEQKLKKMGLSGNAKLSWRVKDQKVFHPETTNAGDRGQKRKKRAMGEL
ncbi:hypothetical protein NFI96_015275, partial [Prochilodus magdalenae]